MDVQHGKNTVSECEILESFTHDHTINCSEKAALASPSKFKKTAHCNTTAKFSRPNFTTNDKRPTCYKFATIQSKTA